ncbi:MAG: hypothetical protein ACSLFQ_13390 [Thermoanaerobaculia bacterium]
MDARDECFDLAGQTSWRTFYAEDHVPGARVDPWNLELRGPGGSAIYPAGASELAAYCKRRVLRSQLEALGRVTQRGDFELTIRFPADRLADVAGLLRCYRRRVLSPERKARAVETLRRARERAESLEDPAPRRATASPSDENPSASAEHHPRSGRAKSDPEASR